MGIERLSCEYCGSRCIDQRGNCGACGAPLPEPPRLVAWHQMNQWNVGGLVSKEYARQNYLSCELEGEVK